jgi:hypothetical protein
MVQVNDSIRVTGNSRTVFGTTTEHSASGAVDK